MKRIEDLLDELEDAAFTRGAEHERRGSQYHDACDRHKAARLALTARLIEAERERDELRAEVERLTAKIGAAMDAVVAAQGRDE